MEQIIKYKNRKLYSRTQSAYVTLTSIREILQKGKTVQVIDHEGNDITEKTLVKVTFAEKMSQF